MLAVVCGPVYYDARDLQKAEDKILKKDHDKVRPPTSQPATHYRPTAWLASLMRWGLSC